MKFSSQDFYLEGVREHLVMHLDQPWNPMHLCIWHGNEYDVVDAKQRHQHQRGLQQFSVTETFHNRNTILYKHLILIDQQ